MTKKLKKITSAMGVENDHDDNFESSVAERLAKLEKKFIEFKKIVVIKTAS